MQPNHRCRMELKHSKSRIDSKNVYKEHVGFPICSQEDRFSTPKALLPDPTAQYQLLPSTSKYYHKIRHGRVNSVITKMIKVGECVDLFALWIREHVRLGPKLSEMVKGKLSLGTRILQVGGVEKVFKQKFIIIDHEKLLSASQCYLSTTAGPIAGLLFVQAVKLLSAVRDPSNSLLQLESFLKYTKRYIK